VAGQDLPFRPIAVRDICCRFAKITRAVAGEPYARIDKRGVGYALRVGYWNTRAEAVKAAKALLPKFRGAHARIASYRPDAIVASAGEQPPAVSAPVPSTPEIAPPSVASASEPLPKAVAPLATTPEVPSPSVASVVEQPSIVLAQFHHARGLAAKARTGEIRGRRARSAPASAKRAPFQL